jgi:hypothetical protein
LAGHDTKIAAPSKLQRVALPTGWSLLNSVNVFRVELISVKFFRGELISVNNVHPYVAGRTLWRDEFTV